MRIKTIVRVERARDTTGEKKMRNRMECYFCGRMSDYKIGICIE